MGDLLRGLGRAAHTLLSSFKWIMIAAAFLSAAFIVWRMESMGRAVMAPIWTITDSIGLTGTSEPEKPLTEAVPLHQQKCGAYDMLSNFVGSKGRSELDQERIIKTWLKYSQEFKVDRCQIFFRQMTLVPPGWGKRKYTWMGVTINVPDRAYAFVEKKFPKAAIDTASLMTQRIVERPDPRWEASVLIRPNADWTLGNQKPDEIAAILGTMDEVIVPDPGEYRYFKPRAKK